MRTVIAGPPPAEIVALIERRQCLGLDLYDEIWEGDYHMNPAPSRDHAHTVVVLTTFLQPFAVAAGLYAMALFNLGEPTSFRVPDMGYTRGEPEPMWISTAEVVIEILSPDDETFAKFDYYAAHHVAEIIVVDPIARTVATLALDHVGRYVQTPRCAALGVDCTAMVTALGWD